VVDLQGSKGVAPKTKFKLKPQRAIGRHRGAQPTFMQVVPSNPLSEDEDEFYYIMGTTTNAMIQKHVILDLDQGGPGENASQVRIGIHKNNNTPITQTPK